MAFAVVTYPWLAEKVDRMERVVSSDQELTVEERDLLLVPYWSLKPGSNRRMPSIVAVGSFLPSSNRRRPGGVPNKASPRPRMMIKGLPRED